MSATGNEVVKLSQLKGTTDAIKSSINNVLEVAQGKTKTYVIANQSAITGTKASDGSYTNVSAITGITMTDLKIGDIILIVDTEVPDLWVSQITPSYTLSKLETTKVDLTGYATTTQLNTKLTGTKLDVNNPNTFIGYNHESNTSPTYFASFKENNAYKGLTFSPVSTLNIPTSVDGLSGGTISSRVTINQSTDTGMVINANNQSASYTGFSLDGTTKGYIGVNSSRKPVFYDSSEKQIALISDIGNPNLLINSDFKINQRGESTYTQTSTSINKYTVDRWHMGVIESGASITCNPLSNGIKVSKTATTSSEFLLLIQKLEDFSKLKGKTVTLSCKFNSNTGSFRLRADDNVGIYYTQTTSESGTISTTFTVADSAVKLRVMIQDLTTSAMSVNIEWMKLEVGSVATTYTPPFMAEELPKCQRYFVRLGGNGTQQVGYGQCATTTIINASIPLPQTMRVNPTKSVNGTLLLRYGTTDITATSVTSSGFYSSGWYATINASGLTVGNMYALRLAGSSNYIDLDAEMY